MSAAVRMRCTVLAMLAAMLVTGCQGSGSQSTLDGDDVQSAIDAGLDLCQLMTATELAEISGGFPVVPTTAGNSPTIGSIGCEWYVEGGPASGLDSHMSVSFTCVPQLVQVLTHTLDTMSTPIHGSISGAGRLTGAATSGSEGVVAPLGHCMMAASGLDRAPGSGQRLAELVYARL